MEALLVTLERDPLVREELWSDVFTVAHRRQGELEGLSESQVRGWLLATTRNLTANAARRAMARRRLIDRLAREFVDWSAPAEDNYFRDARLNEDEDQLGKLKSVWDELSHAEREILALDALGHKGPMIADRLNVSHQAARLRLMRARQAFRDAYHRSEGQLP